MFDSRSNTTFRAEHLMGPMLDVLRDLVQVGGTVARPDVDAKMLRNMPKYRQERPWIIRDQPERDLRQRLNWAAYYLREHGCLERPHGMLLLTQKGCETHLTDEDSFRIASEVNKAKKGSRPRKPQIREQKMATPLDGPDVNTRNTGAGGGAPGEQLTKLTPGQFEHLCTELLQALGITRLQVTGRAGDGGIDGIGVLVANHIEQKRVAIQCKKYTGSVGPSHVRDFRGATAGRADIRLLITTAHFTAEARREAERDGAERIGLIDGDELMSLFPGMV